MYRKNSADLTEEYDFNENIIVTTPSLMKKKGRKNINKVDDSDFFIPEIKQYEIIMILNYNVKQLKDICKHYNQKLGGNKDELKKRVYNHLKHSHYIIKLQRLFKRKLYDKYILLRGIAHHNTNLCVNETDFVSLIPLTDIPYYSFYSYTNDDITYGFQVGSLKTYIDTNIQNGKDQQNPYDRSVIPNDKIMEFYSFIHLSKIFKYPIDLELELDDHVFNEEDIIRNKTLDLFQHMDSLGHYTNPSWFLNLDVRKLLRYIRELHDIWDYRAQLDEETKQNIHYPNGTPFNGIMNNPRDINHLRKTILQIIENFITKGRTTEFKYLGSMYVLGAFTLVSQGAADALPWLFESVVHI
jgi:hypothetical protein